MAKKATPNPKDKPWKEAIIQVMSGTHQAMHYNDITEKIINQKLRVTLGATPKSTVYNYLNEEFRRKKESSDFIKVGPGEFILRNATGETKEVSTAGEKDLADGHPVEDEPANDEQEAIGAIQAFGMFWRRDAVRWKNNLQLWGQQNAGTEKVDFAKQKGIYLLHDGQRTVYVGRVVDQPLGVRLHQHTTDRLNGRWDRFSWFGLSIVTDKGELQEQSEFKLKPGLFIATLEALLIEAVEPPLNRKRGDDFRAMEYLQAEDPEFRKQQQNALKKELMDKISNL